MAAQSWKKQREEDVRASTDSPSILPQAGLPCSHTCPSQRNAPLQKTSLAGSGGYHADKTKFFPLSREFVWSQVRVTPYSFDASL